MSKVVIHRDFPGGYAHAQSEDCWCLPVVSDAVMDERPQEEVLAETADDEEARATERLRYL